MRRQPAWWAEARELYEKGWGYSRIARKLKKNHSSVMYAVDMFFRMRKQRQNVEYMASYPEDQRRLIRRKHNATYAKKIVDKSKSVKRLIILNRLRKLAGGLTLTELEALEAQLLAHPGQHSDDHPQ